MRKARQLFLIAGAAGVTAACSAVAIAGVSRADTGAATPGTTAAATTTGSATATRSTAPPPSSTATNSPGTDYNEVGLDTAAGSCTPADAGKNSTLVSVTTPNTPEAGTPTYSVIFEYGASGGSRQVLRDMKPGQTRSLKFAWPTDAGPAAVHVQGGTGYDGPTIAQSDHPNFVTCAAAASSGPVEPPTPSPVTTQLGVTG